MNVSIEGDDYYTELAANPITVTITDKATQTITAADVTATFGDTDKRVSASVTNPTTGGGAISYAVKTGSENYIEVDALTGALTIKKAGTAIVVATAAGTEDYAVATKEVTVTINKANTTVTVPTANTLVYTGAAQALVNAGSASGGTLQYAVTTKNTEPTDDAYNAKIPTETNAGTYYVWFKAVGDENHFDTTPDFVTVKLEKAELSPAPTVNLEGWTYGETAKTPAVSGNTGYGAVTFGYKPKDGEQSPYSYKVPTDAGDYTVKATIAETANYKSASASADFTISKAPAPILADDQKPTAKTGLAYNGTAQELVSAPKETPAGYTLKYSVDGGNTWSSSIPTGTLPGNYTIKVMYEGDSNHESFNGDDLTVSVANGYVVYSGNNQTWEKGSSSSVEIIFKAGANDDETYKKWNRQVIVDGAAISKTAYDANPGSLKVELKSAYLETLGIGKHTMDVMFEDGSASAVFNIKEKSSSGGGTSTPAKKTDNVVTCQMAGYPSDYAWNEAAKACQPGYIDDNGAFRSIANRNRVVNTYDKGLTGNVISLAASTVFAIITAYVLRKCR